jgi:phosphate transport system protein
MTLRVTFESELKKLHTDIEEMGTEVQKLFVKLFLAQEKKEKEELIEVTKCDRDIHMMQRNIESSCLNLITAALKAVNDISRIGDQCADIAELFLRMNFKDIAEFSRHMKTMEEETKKQFDEAMEVFIHNDIVAAVRVTEKDDVVDDMFNLVKDDLICHLKEDGKDSDDCVDVLMIAKHLEKIGDHAVNIAEWAIFSETGQISNVRLL